VIASECERPVVDPSVANRVWSASRPTVPDAKSLWPAGVGHLRVLPGYAGGRDARERPDRAFDSSLGVRSEADPQIQDLTPGYTIAMIRSDVGPLAADGCLSKACVDQKPLQWRERRGVAGACSGGVRQSHPWSSEITRRRFFPQTELDSI